MTEGSFSFNGERVAFQQGQSVAGALIAAGVSPVRYTRSGAARHVFCGIGNCWDCLASSDPGDVPVRTCLTPAVADTTWAPSISTATAGSDQPRLAAKTDLRSTAMVVGAGPAGIAAASHLVRRGIDITVIDAGEQPGGQLLRPSRLKEADGGIDGRAGIDIGDGEHLRYLSSSAVWHLRRQDDGWRAEVTAAAGQTAVISRYVVLATGAHEYVRPFPGWHLPGVMAAGGAQRFAKGDNAFWGRQILVAGNGPLLLTVAATLARLGADVTLALDARFKSAIRAVSSAGLRRILEAAGYGSALLRGGTRIMLGATLLRCDGDDRVRTALVRHRGKDHTISVDSLAVSHGLVPDTTLAVSAGALCQPAGSGGRALAADHRQRSSVEGLLAAGETTGIGGGQLGRLEGANAALTIAEAEGHPSTAAEVKRIQKAITRERRSVASLLRALPDGDWLDDIDPDTIVCRCEEVSARSVPKAVESGAWNLRSIKALTRAGMGYCQGRTCGPILRQYATRLVSRDVGWLDNRLIGTPVSLAELSAEHHDLTNG